MLRHAEGIIPVLRECAAATETSRALPDQTARGFLDAGFYRIPRPRHYPMDTDRLV